MPEPKKKPVIPGKIKKHVLVKTGRNIFDFYPESTVTTKSVKTSNI
jgi:hypothetical protein